MMRGPKLLIIFLWPCVLFSQVDVNQMIYTQEFVFTDSRGNTDTIRMSYVPGASRFDDPEFGEVNISEVPYDSVLDVRVATYLELQDEIFGGNDHIDYEYKHAVGEVWTTDPRRICSTGGMTGFAIVIYAKYYPLTVTTDRDNWNLSSCRIVYTLTNSLGFNTIRNWYDLAGVESACLGIDESYTFTGVMDRLDLDQLIFVDEVVAGDSTRLDTIQTFHFTQSEECARRVSVADRATALPLSLSPNPVLDRVNWQLPTDIRLSEAAIFDASGRHWRTVSQPASGLVVTDLPRGAYVLRARSREGQLFVGRFIR